MSRPESRFAVEVTCIEYRSGLWPVPDKLLIHRVAAP
jgi:hypothetical protein